MTQILHTPIPQEAPNPDNSLPAISTPADLPTGHSVFHSRYHRLHSSQTGRLPYSSDMGPTTKGPKPRPSRNMLDAIRVVAGLIRSSSAICSSEAAIMLADMVVARWLSETMRMMVTLWVVRHVYGLEGWLAHWEEGWMLVKWFVNWKQYACEEESGLTS